MGESRLKSVGLFSGIGGFEVGLEKAGIETTLMCEIDPAAQAVLRKRMPHVEIKDDVRLIGQVPKGTDLRLSVRLEQRVSGHAAPQIQDSADHMRAETAIKTATRQYWPLRKGEANIA